MFDGAFVIITIKGWHLVTCVEETSLGAVVIELREVTLLSHPLHSLWTEVVKELTLSHMNVECDTSIYSSA